MKKCLILLFVLLWQYGLRANIVPGELIVHIKTNTTISEVLQPLGIGFDVDRIAQNSSIYLVKIDAQLQPEVLNQIKQSENVIAAQYNHFVKSRAIPNDANFDQQWDKLNEGQDGGTASADIDVTDVWDLTTGITNKYGDTIVIAVIDEDFNNSTTDINWFINKAEIPNNGVDDDTNGVVDDYEGFSVLNSSNFVDSGSFSAHGTQAASVAASIGNNSIGIAGVTWGAKVLMLSYDDGSFLRESNVVACYDYVIGMRKRYNASNGADGAYIVATNSSFGVDNAHPEEFPVWCAMFDSMGACGIVSAAATTNSNRNVDTRGDIPTTCASNFLISVTAHDRNAEHGFTGFGVEHIDIHAPGIEIPLNGGRDQIDFANGTSYASPQVAGAVALLHSNFSTFFLDRYALKPDSLALITREIVLNSAEPFNNGELLNATGGRLNLSNAFDEQLKFDPGCNIGLDIEFNNVKCFDEAASIEFEFNANATYVWNDGITSNQRADLLPNQNYQVTVTNNDCTIKRQFRVNEQTNLSFNNIETTPFTDTTTGSIFIEAIGNEVLFAINDTQNFIPFPVFDSLLSGTYTVFIKNDDQCIDSTEVNIENRSTQNLFTLEGDLNQQFLTVNCGICQKSTVQILAMNGSIVYEVEFQHTQNDIKQIDLSTINLTPAVYLGVFESDKGNQTIQFAIP